MSKFYEFLKLRGEKTIGGDTHMTSTLTGRWGVMQKWDVMGRTGRGGGGVSECSGRPIFIKENWISAMTRHHAEPSSNILLTRNLPFNSDVRQWSHPLMIPLHCLWAKSNNRTRGQFQFDLVLFFFRFPLFFFIRSNLRVAQNGRFVINPVYLEVVPWSPQFGILGSLESLEKAFFRTLLSPKLILESWIPHYLCESSPEYPLGITIGTFNNSLF